MKRSRPKREFSKILLVCVSIVTLLLTMYVCILAWVTMDMSVFAYLIPAVFTELATATGFYYAKAKAENEIKLNKLMEKENCYANRSDPRI